MARKKDKRIRKPSLSEIEEPPGAQRATEPAKRTSRIPIVGIGASAGGLDAFKRFFSAMPSKSGMAFVLIPHLDLTHRSLMVALLSRQTAMQVCEAGDGMRIEANCVYIIPPSRDLSLKHGRLCLTSPAGRERMTAIDGFFRSLAADQREQAIGIVLSGTGSHGTPGLKEIKLAGGMVMAQDPDTAEYDQMPQSAVDTGIIDYILAPAQMPQALINYVRQPYVHSPQPLTAAEAAVEQIAPVLHLLRGRSRFDFRCYRKNMLLRRIRRRMGIREIEEASDYVAFLSTHPEEITALSRDLLIGVTSFFRDPGAFQILQQQIIPGLVERQTGDIPVRVWVPACATGEEAYSLGILLLEQFAATSKPANFQIFASDIDEESVDVARRGVYAASIICELSPQRIRQFFVKTDENHYQVNQQLRGSIVFTRQNVISDAPFSKLDLVSCRNLLIYLEPELQQKLLSLFHFALNDRGYLFLGCSESIGRKTDLFEPVSKKWRVHRRIGTARYDWVQVPVRADTDRRIRVGKFEPSPRPRMGFAEMLQKLLLARYAPAAVLINRQYEVLSLSGRTSDYLELPTGELTRDLMCLARPSLRGKIRAACHKVLGSGEEAVIDACLSRNGSCVVCTIAARLLHEPEEADGLLLVVFQDRAAEAASVSSRTLPAEAESDVVRRLEYEVESTRKDLRSSIEEVRSANEEVMSMNEEFQSANEELETSKEELQSFNDELSMVNSQLQEKVDELERANNDIRNLLISREIATVFLDTDLRIKRFTRAAAQLLNLMEADVGRPLRDFALKLTDQLPWDAGRVLDQLTPVETEVRAEPGRCYLRRIVPYRTGDNQIDGVVVTFVDITEREKAEAQSQRLAAVLRDSNDAVMLLDMDGRITAWNRGAEEMYGYSEAEALRLTIADLVIPEERVAQETLLGRIARGNAHESFEARRVTKEGSVLDVWVKVARLADDSDRPTAIAKTDRDITERKQFERALIKSARRMRAIVETATDAIITISEQGLIESFNPAAERMFGYSAQETIGQNIRILMPSPYREQFDLRISRYRETGESRIIGVNREWVGRRKDGSTFSIELVVSELQDGPRRIFTGIIRDISDRKSLQRELLTIVSEEQRRIAQDLHDGLGQKLTGFGMLAGSLAETLDANSPSDAEAAHRLAVGLESALEQLRSLSNGLLPTEVDAGGLGAAITELAEVSTRDSGVPCDVLCDEPVRVESNETATHLYRIAQQALTNALKHGAPRRVTISLARKDGGIVLCIRDDGKGFSSASFHGLGIGFKTMHYRAALIGATLSITGARQGGVMVTCRLGENMHHG